MKRKALFTLILGTVLAIVPAANAAVMLDEPGGGSSAVAGRPYGTSNAEQQAVLARGQALNALYGNAVTQLSPAQFKSLYQAGGDRLQPQELAALVARSQAMNSGYGVGGVSPVVTIRPDFLGRDGATPAQATAASTAGGGDSVASNAALGAVALTGAMLLALGFVVISRRRQKLSF